MKVRADLAIQMVQVPPQALEALGVVRLDGRRAMLLELLHLRLDSDFVDAFDVVMHMRVDAERLAQGGQQMLLVQLREAFHGFVVEAFRNLAQLVDGLALELFVGVRHDSLPNGYFYRVRARYSSGS